MLVGGFNPSEKFESDGIIIPTIGENNNHVPNHQPVMVFAPFRPFYKYI